MVQIVNGSPVYTVRIMFKKLGDLQYISHLDLVRTMSKVVTRTKLPLWYTEGFNPKPKMVFAAPLSIGTESFCEFMDLRLTERVPKEEVKARFNMNMADNLQVIEAYYPDAPLTDLKWLSYTVKISTLGADSSMVDACRAFLDSERIEIQKKSKKGEITADIKPMIKEYALDIEDGIIKLSMVLSSSADAYLNPELVIKALRQGCGILSSEDLTAEWYSVTREAAYRTDMTEFR
ncbi:MAG: TIGR03936 family radical SAM-associated protein [Clostridia bacterium]|nr:TIGR03936 family radical SAM-associated protein [Clostridia bacterium]